MFLVQHKMDVTTLLVVAAIIAIAALFLLRPKKKGVHVVNSLRKAGRPQGPQGPGAAEGFSRN